MNLQWLGFAWNPELRSYPALCSPWWKIFPFHNIWHGCHKHQLSGRYFLSTTFDMVVTNTSYLDITPLATYNFLCNVSFSGMKTSLAMCLKNLHFLLPLFLLNQSYMFMGSKPKWQVSTLLHQEHDDAYMIRTKNMQVSLQEYLEYFCTFN